jgi:hypothetical protein
MEGSGSVEVRATPECVYDLLADITRMGEWTLARSVRATAREHERRPDGYIEAVTWRPVKEADREFRLWLDFLRIEREELPDEAIRVDTGRAQGGDQRRYLVRPDAIPE